MWGPGVSGVWRAGLKIGGGGAVSQCGEKALLGRESERGR